MFLASDLSAFVVIRFAGRPTHRRFVRNDLMKSDRDCEAFRSIPFLTDAPGLILPFVFEN